MELWSTCRGSQEGGSGQKCACMWQDGAVESRFSEIPHGSGSQEESEEGSVRSGHHPLSLPIQESLHEKSTTSCHSTGDGAGGAW